MATERFNILDLKPEDTPNYMVPAWLACIRWALNEPSIMTWFRSETGNTWTPATTAIAEMIDRATGADVEFLKAFVVWVGVRVWGPIDDVPDSARNGKK